MLFSLRSSGKHFFQSLTQFLIRGLLSRPRQVQIVDDGLVIGVQLLSLAEVTDGRLVIFQLLVKISNLFQLNDK